MKVRLSCKVRLFCTISWQLEPFSWIHSQKQPFTFIFSLSIFIPPPPSFYIPNPQSWNPQSPIQITNRQFKSPIGNLITNWWFPLLVLYYEYFFLHFYLSIFSIFFSWNGCKLWLYLPATLQKKNLTTIFHIFQGNVKHIYLHFHTKHSSHLGDTQWLRAEMVVVCWPKMFLRICINYIFVDFF